MKERLEKEKFGAFYVASKDTGLQIVGHGQKDRSPRVAGNAGSMAIKLTCLLW